jgi:TIR domain-containing protein
MYEWDVFLSYNHDPVMEPWVPDHLVPLLQSLVGNELARPIRIFYDRTGITSGQSWPLVLRTALGRSRCLVGVWHPLYFHSDWCRRECAIMVERERQTGYRTPVRPDGLIVPINVFDGIHFPPLARDIQSFDLKKYWIAGPAFRASLLYVDFQIALRTFAAQLAAAIDNAPPWDASFMDAAHLDVGTDELLPPAVTNFAFPGTE